jgi:hypothetical protein
VQSYASRGPRTNQRTSLSRAPSAPARAASEHPKGWSVRVSHDSDRASSHEPCPKPKPNP